jgi:hypothetical protein
VSADQLAGILDAIAAAPALERGLCVGHWDLWDATDDPAAVDHAVRLCLECPVLTSCRQYVDSLPKSKRPPGVVAGELHTGTPKRKAG